MDNICKEEFTHSIDWADFEAVEAFIYQPNELPYDHEYIANKLIQNSWPVTYVAELGILDLTKLFLESADSINVNDDKDDDEGWSVLHHAACRADIDLVKLVLEHGADPNKMDRHSFTPLYYLHLDFFGYDNWDVRLEIMKMLIGHGAEAVTMTNTINVLQIGSTLLHGDEKSVEFVLTLDIDLRARYDSDDNTVLHYLARNKHPNVITKIRGKDFDVNSRNVFGETPLWQANRFGIVDAVEFLLSQGADVNAADDENCTPLLVAIRYYKSRKWIRDRYKKCIQILIEHGADIQAGSHQDGVPTVFHELYGYWGQNENPWLNRLIIEYLVLQEAEGMEISRFTQREINSVDEMKKYFNYCKDLLATEVYRTETLLEFRRCNKEKLLSYMRNADFVREVKDFCDKLKLQTVSYGDWLEKRLDEANRTAILRDSAALFICKLMKINYHGYSFIVDSILRYLRDEDLEVLLSISF